MEVYSSSCCTVASRRSSVNYVAGSSPVLRFGAGSSIGRASTHPVAITCQPRRTALCTTPFLQERVAEDFVGYLSQRGNAGSNPVGRFGACRPAA